VDPEWLGEILDKETGQRRGAYRYCGFAECCNCNNGQKVCEPHREWE